ncbi:MAG: DUF1565 domain-containing protein [Candidatus Binatia bacterium]
MRGASFISACILLAACGGGGGGGQGSSQPQTFYVSPSGSDRNNGLSPDRPFRTLGRAVDGLQPGDTVYVAPGTYTPPAAQPGGKPPAEVVEIKGLAGTLDAPIAIIADPGGEQTGAAPGDVVVDGEGVAVGLRVSRSTPVILDGFRVVPGARRQRRRGSRSAVTPTG